MTFDLTSGLKNNSILITGGSGFFGKNICEYLVKLNQENNLGMKIYSLARTPIQQEGVHFIQHDVTRPFLFDLNIDFLIHAATPVGSDDDFNKNIDIIVNGTKNVLQFAEKAKVKKLLLVSSGAVYGQQPSELEAFDEDYIAKEPFFDFNSAYTTGKRIAELLALDWSRRTGKHLNIARCFAFSGRHLPLDHLAIGNFVRDALLQKVIKVKGDGTAIRSYMDEDDLVVWLLTILVRADNREIFNVGSDQEICMKDLAHTIAELVSGTSVVIQNENISSEKRNRYIPSINKAKLKLGLALVVELKDSIQKMIDFNRGLQK